MITLRKGQSYYILNIEPSVDPSIVILNASSGRKGKTTYGRPRRNGYAFHKTNQTNELTIKATTLLSLRLSRGYASYTNEGGPSLLAFEIQQTSPLLTTAYNRALEYKPAYNNIRLGQQASCSLCDEIIEAGTGILFWIHGDFLNIACPPCIA